MREEFDSHFEHPRRQESSKAVEFLVLRTGGHRVALRVTEIAGLYRCPKVTRFPNEGPAVVGLIALQGSMVVVYDAAVLLHVAVSPGATGWIVLLRGDRTCALLFESPEGYQRVPEENIVVTANRLAESQGSTQAFVLDGEPVVIVGHQRWEHAIVGATPSESPGDIQR
jgi:chemotaxis signal transduction protein